MPTKGELKKAAKDFYLLTYNGEDFPYAFVEERSRSFTDSKSAIVWPFQENSTCTPEKMAEAGFYFVGTDDEPDIARCYYCRGELDGWEPTDDPWQEHARRECPFIELGKKPKDLTVHDMATLETSKFAILLKKLQSEKMEKLTQYANECRQQIENFSKAKGKKSKRARK